VPIEESTVVQRDQLAARLAKKRRLAHITRAGLAQEAGVGLEVIERIETGRPVAHADLVAVLDTIANSQSRSEQPPQVPEPRLEPTAEQLGQAAYEAVTSQVTSRVTSQVTSHVPRPAANRRFNRVAPA